MNKKDKRRRNIFERFSSNLKLLIDKGFLKGIEPKFKNTYICPICLNHFSEKNLDQTLENPLTLEDVPPKTLGGKANILTCNECNNKCGYRIDHHLTNGMKMLDAYEFIPGTEFDLDIEIKNRFVKARVKVGENKEFSAIINKEHNNPKKVDDFNKLAIKESIINLDFENLINDFRLKLALLKIGYLFTFLRYGYSFILDPAYNSIREQLKNPDKEIHSKDFILKNLPYGEKMYGAQLVLNKGIESIIVTFPLKTINSKRIYGTIITLPYTSIEKIINKYKNSEGELLIAESNNIDYLKDINAITNLLNWIKEKN